MDFATLASSIGSVASAIATIVLVVLTAKYVRLTHALVEESRQAKYPNVFVDIEFDEINVKFLVGNAGDTPALNIQFQITDQVPWRTTGSRTTGINAITAVKSGISYLAPGRTLKFNAGYVEHDTGFFAQGSSIEVLLTFETEDREKLTRQSSIDLTSYTDILFETFKDPQREVAKAIRDSSHDRHSGGAMEKLLHNMFKKSCPSCRELISSKATKCPHCQDFVTRGRVARRR